MTIENLTTTERLILSNQFDIFAKLEEIQVDDIEDLNNNHLYKDYKFKADILRKGYSGMYDRVFEWISEETDPEIYIETTDILRMYRHIDNSIGGLNEEEKQEMNLDSIAFKGFDGHEKHYHIMMLMYENGLWLELNNKDKDSHGEPDINHYRSILEVFNEIREEGRPNLNRDQIQLLIDAVN